MIRRLVASDAEGYIVVRSEALECEPFAFGTSAGEDIARSVVRARRMLADRQNAVFGAFDPDLVGVVGVRRQSRKKLRHKAELWGMYVRLEQRGRGLGRQLMEAAIAYAREQDGVRLLHLVVTERAVAAAVLYDKLGFLTWGIEPAGLHVDGADITEKHMVLTL